MKREQDWFDQFIGSVHKSYPDEYVIEFAQNEGNVKYRTEAMLLLPKGFDISKPFMFNLSENNGNKEIQGFSSTMIELIDSVVANKNKKKGGKNGNTRKE